MTLNGRISIAQLIQKREELHNSLTQSILYTNLNSPRVVVTITYTSYAYITSVLTEVITSRQTTLIILTHDSTIVTTVSNIATATSIYIVTSIATSYVDARKIKRGDSNNTTRMSLFIPDPTVLRAVTAKPPTVTLAPGPIYDVLAEKLPSRGVLVKRASTSIYSVISVITSIIVTTVRHTTFEYQSITATSFNYVTRTSVVDAAVTVHITSTTVVTLLITNSKAPPGLTTSSGATLPPTSSTTENNDPTTTPGQSGGGENPTPSPSFGATTSVTTTPSTSTASITASSPASAGGGTGIVLDTQATGNTASAAASSGSVRTTPAAAESSTPPDPSVVTKIGAGIGAGVFGVTTLAAGIVLWKKYSCLPGPRHDLEEARSVPPPQATGKSHTSSSGSEPCSPSSETTPPQQEQQPHDVGGADPSDMAPPQLSEYPHEYRPPNLKWSDVAKHHHHDWTGPNVACHDENCELSRPEHRCEDSAACPCNCRDDDCVVATQRRREQFGQDTVDTIIGNARGYRIGAIMSSL